MVRSFESMNRLNKGDLVVLKNSLGKTIDSDELQNVPSVYSAFYKTHILNWQEEPAKEPAYFVAACIWALQGQNGSYEFAEAWSIYTKKKNSESLNLRMNRLLDMDFDERFVDTLAGMIKMLHTEGFSVNCETLAEDLWSFMWNKKQIQRKWFRIIHKVKEDDEDRR